MRFTNKIKRFALAVLFACALFPSCNNYKNIPDRDLTGIFKDVFVANAYISTRQYIQPGRDSLDVYRPILASYGYTMRDFEYTLANFSKRKSVKLSDVVERAVRELEAEESEFRYRGSLIDSVESRAQRAYLETIISDSTITATAISDTAKLKVIVPVREGIYEVRYIYDIDSTDTNRQLKSTFEFTDPQGTVTGTNTNWMTSRKRSNVDLTLTPKEGDSLLTIRFGNYRDDLTRPHLTIDSLYVIYKPTVDEALDSLNRKLLPYKDILDRWE